MKMPRRSGISFSRKCLMMPWRLRFYTSFDIHNITISYCRPQYALFCVTRFFIVLTASKFTNTSKPILGYNYFTLPNTVVSNEISGSFFVRYTYYKIGKYGWFEMTVLWLKPISVKHGKVIAFQK